MSTQLSAEMISSKAPAHVSPTDIEQTIERIGAQYIADLRTLSDEFVRFYNMQLAEKDAQIKDLGQRLEAATQERDKLREEIDELRRTSAEYVNELRVLSENLSRHLHHTSSSAST